MEGSMGVGFMAVFAVSGSVVLVAHQVHKRLFSNFMKTIEFELNGTNLYSHARKRCDEKNMQGKKVVRFAEDVVEPSSNNKEYRKKHYCVTKPALMDKTAVADLDLDHHHHHHHHHHHNQGYRMEDTMPPNRIALYKGILQYRTLKGHVY